MVSSLVYMIDFSEYRKLLGCNRKLLEFPPALSDPYQQRKRPLLHSPVQLRDLLEVHGRQRRGERRAAKSQRDGGGDMTYGDGNCARMAANMLGEVEAAREDPMSGASQRHQG
eukprot:747881-Hanusia_phi.AAC.2